MSSVGFFERAASTAWEPVTFPGLPGPMCWVWYRPETLPHGVAVTLPPERVAPSGTLLPFSLLQLVQVLGLNWDYLASVSLYGGNWQPAVAWQMAATQALPAPVAETGLAILLAGQVPAEIAQPVGTDAVAAPGAEIRSGELDRLDSDWRACQGMERQLSGIRKQLSGVLAKLGSYDRDLRPNERIVATREQKDAWEDARRWIRDVAAKVSRSIKAHDIGITSAAGRRNQIELTWKNTMAQGAATPDVAAAQHEVEVYRKELANLMNSMGSALQGASTNGVGRAQRVLTQIAAQRAKERKKNRVKNNRK